MVNVCNPSVLKAKARKSGVWYQLELHKNNTSHPEILNVLSKLFLLLFQTRALWEKFIRKQ